MDSDTILLGNINTQYADVNGKVKGNIEVGGKAELGSDAVIIGDINASTISVLDGAVIQGILIHHTCKKIVRKSSPIQ